MQTNIIADNREISSGVPQMLVNKDANVKMAQLASGDYIINDEIIIERKTKEDFVQSIITGHLFNQCSKLRKSGLLPLIIVEGNPFKTNHPINPKAIKGALLSVSLSWQIPVIKSAGKEDTVSLILTAAYQVTHPPSFIKRRGRKPKTASHLQHYLVQSLPMVGPALAYRLLDYFGSIEKIILAKPDELQQVEGIGRRKAELMFNFFRKSQ
jgi:Fanconi anemia group M protein